MMRKLVAILIVVVLADCAVTLVAAPTLQTAKFRMVAAIAEDGDMSALGEGGVFIYHDSQAVLAIDYDDATGWPVMLIKNGRTGRRAVFNISELLKSKHYVKER
jgi:hypothetical protein